jgi:hypothetical protein
MEGLSSIWGTLSSEAEFLTAIQAGQEVLYLRALLKGIAYLHHSPTEIWEDNASCILMSENPTNRERSRHVDVSVCVCLLLQNLL